MDNSGKRNDTFLVIAQPSGRTFVSWSYEFTLGENILSIYSAITSNAASWIRPKDKELLPKYEGKTIIGKCRINQQSLYMVDTPKRS